jgi:hypothetical protein
MKCDKCGYDDNGTGDTAHYCGKLPALIVQHTINPRLKELMLEAGYAAPELASRAHKLAELIVRECCDMFVELRTRPADLAAGDVKKHFGVEQ